MKQLLLALTLSLTTSVATANPAALKKIRLAVLDGKQQVTVKVNPGDLRLLKIKVAIRQAGQHYGPVKITNPIAGTYKAKWFTGKTVKRLIITMDGRGHAK